MIDLKEVENKFLEKLNNKLLNKTFERGETFPADIPKYVGETFIIDLLGYYPGVMEFDVKPKMKGNVILVKVESNNETTMADIIMTIELTESTLTIKNILVSLKNLAS